MRKRTLLALVLSLLVFGGVFATANTLNGITSAKVSADNTTIASCDPDGVTTSYGTAWDATNHVYDVSSVTVSGVADTCDGQTLSVTITDSTGAQIGSGSTAIPTSAATSFTVTLSPTPSAKLASNVHVLIAS
ncbi:MAG TPA: hypothetical protein VE269_06950 [Gaiellaceae bacterium]|nr:hypothetical protein [Gaiellaceae bacterium]